MLEGFLITQKYLKNIITESGKKVGDSRCIIKQFTNFRDFALNLDNGHLNQLLLFK